MHKMACKWYILHVYWSFSFFFIKGGLRHSNISLFGSRHFLLPRSDAGGVWRRTKAFLHPRRMYTHKIVLYCKNIIQIENRDKWSSLPNTCNISDANSFQLIADSFKKSYLLVSNRFIIDFFSCIITIHVGIKKNHLHSLN